MAQYCDLQPNNSGPFRCSRCGKRTSNDTRRYVCTVAVPRGTKLLGDHVAEALKKIGVTPESVEKLIGRKCNCEKRRILL